MKRFSIAFLLLVSFSTVGCTTSQAIDKKPNSSITYNGSEEQAEKEEAFILTNQTSNHSPFIIQNETLYYSNWNENNKISQTKLPQSSSKLLSKDILNQYNFSTESLALIGNILYFADGSKNNSLTSLNLLDNKSMQLNSNSVHTLSQVDSILYYINLKDQKLYSYNTETSKGGAISLDKVGKYILNNNTILYQNLDDNSKLYKINLDGSSRKALTEFPVESFTVFEDEIIVSNSMDHNYIYSVSSINLETKRISLTPAFNIKGLNNKIYFLSGENSSHLKELTIKSPTEEPTVSTKINININDYFLSDSGIFFRKSTDVNTPYYLNTSN